MHEHITHRTWRFNNRTRSLNMGGNHSKPTRKRSTRMSVNKVILVGRLGANPETRQFQDGGSLCTLSLATTESWRDKTSGERQERTEWHRVALRNKLGEIAQQYLSKGAQVYIEGRIQTRKWQDSKSEYRYSTDIIATEMRMLGGKQGDAQAPTRQPQAPQPAPLAGAPTDTVGKALEQAFSTAPADLADDIPF